MRRLMTRAASFSLMAVLVAGCSDAGPSNLSQLGFSLATQVGAPAAAVGASFAVNGTPETFTDGASTLVVTQVQVVLRKIELRRAGALTDCVSGLSDDCEELELGPVLVDVPLGTPGAARNFSVQIAPGSYDRLDLEVHKPSSSEDAGFVQANPAFDGVSVRVTGTYNGADFIYSGDMNTGIRFDLNPALVANETAATDLTLFVNLDQWFRDQAGMLLDPVTANAGQPNESLVEQNITGSLDAFEDNNRDGRDDGPSLP